jgi:hypothetical protein
MRQPGGPVRLSRRAVLLAAPALLLPGETFAAAADRPLWPGARYTVGERARAIRHGMRFIEGSARVEKNFAENADDYLWCFYSIAATAADPALRRQAWRMGVERATQWRRDHREVPADAQADDVVALVSGSYAADRLGVHDPAIKDKLRRAAAKFSPKDFFEFDPTKNPMPADVPEPCSPCERTNPRDVRKCSDCTGETKMQSPYDLLCYSLITAYFGNRYGVLLGADLADVTQWIARLRPYPRFDNASSAAFIHVAYAITHIVYVLNDYGRYRLRPEWLPDEFEFLKSHLMLNIAVDDAETMGEFLDTLKSFGLTQSDPLIRAGMEFVLSRQNADGSWGQADSADVYHRYHSTWTGVNGLMDYTFASEGVSFPEALRRARGGPPT